MVVGRCDGSTGLRIAPSDLGGDASPPRGASSSRRGAGARGAPRGSDRRAVQTAIQLRIRHLPRGELGCPSVRPPRRGDRHDARDWPGGLVHAARTGSLRGLDADGEPGPAADLCGAAGRDGPSGRGPHDGARNSAAGVDRIGGALSGAVREQPKPSFRLYPRHVGAARRQRGRGQPVRLHARRISGDDPRGDASARRRARPARPRCQV